MRNLLTLSASILVLISVSAMANPGLDKAKAKYVKHADEEIAVISDFKACINAATTGKDFRPCNLDRAATVKKLRADRTKK